MSQKATAMFQLIGSCAKMQRVSWDEEIKLIGGLFYTISFNQDFKTIYLFEQPITEWRVTTILELIIEIEREQTIVNHFKSWVQAPVHYKEKPIPVKRALRDFKKARNFLLDDR